MAAGRVEQVTVIQRSLQWEIGGDCFQVPLCAGDRYTEVAVKQVLLYLQIRMFITKP